MTPNVEISCFGQTLVAGKDYKISYSNNKKPGTGKYTITFLGNYKGSEKITDTFEISPASVADAEVKLQNKVFTKAGKYASTPYVSINGVGLTKKDYTVFYMWDGEEVKSLPKITEDDLDENGVLEVEVVVYGKGNYDSETSATGTYQIKKIPADQDLSKAKVVIRNKKTQKKVSSFQYTGSEITIGADDEEYEVYVTIGKSKVELKQGEDFTVSYVNNVNKGKATMILTGLGEEGTGSTQYFGSKTTTFKIVKAKLKTL